MTIKERTRRRTKAPWRTIVIRHSLAVEVNKCTNTVTGALAQIRTRELRDPDTANTLPHGPTRISCSTMCHNVRDDDGLIDAAAASIRQ